MAKTPNDDPLIAIVETWAAHFGYYDDKIDLKNGDLGLFTTPDCTLTAHAPLWRTKKGEEQSVPVAHVRQQLARMQRTARVARHNLHMAVHPDGRSLCLFFVVKGRLAFVPFTMMTVPMVFVVQTIETDDGLRISEVHERSAPTLEKARLRLLEHHDWPDETTFEPYVGFGAVS